MFLPTGLLARLIFLFKKFDTWNPFLPCKIPLNVSWIVNKRITLIWRCAVKLRGVFKVLYKQKLYLFKWSFCIVYIGWMYTYASNTWARGSSKSLNYPPQYFQLIIRSALTKTFGQNKMIWITYAPARRDTSVIFQFSRLFT